MLKTLSTSPTFAKITFWASLTLSVIFLILAVVFGIQLVVAIAAKMSFWLVAYKCFLTFGSIVVCLWNTIQALVNRNRE